MNNISAISFVNTFNTGAIWANRTTLQRTYFTSSGASRLTSGIPSANITGINLNFENKGMIRDSSTGVYSAKGSILTSYPLNSFSVLATDKQCIGMERGNFFSTHIISCHVYAENLQPVYSGYNTAILNYMSAVILL